MTLLKEFITTFEVPEEAQPYVPIMIDEQEMKLIVSIKGKKMTLDEMVDHLGMSREETLSLLERSYSQGLIDKKLEGKEATYSPKNFVSFMPIYQRFGNLDDIPEEGRKSIHRWYHQQYVKKRQPLIDQIMKGARMSDLDAQGVESATVSILLLSEAEEMIDGTTDIVVVPCNCRRLSRNCNRPTETCIWMRERALKILDRGHGKRLTKEEAKKVVREADKKGLVHVGTIDWRTRNDYGICNCCGCDCIALTTAQGLGSKWPKVRYVASHDRERCNLCGSCVKRCYFGAFYLDGSVKEIKGKKKEGVTFRPEKCWGCGLCANTCPSQAISMLSLV